MYVTKHHITATTSNFLTHVSNELIKQPLLNKIWLTFDTSLTHCTLMNVLILIRYCFKAVHKSTIFLTTRFRCMHNKWVWSISTVGFRRRNLVRCCGNLNISTWWRNQIETFPTLPALYEGNPPVTGGFSSQRPVTRSFDVSFDLRLNKRFSKHPRGRWFETQSRSLWRPCDEIVMLSEKTRYICIYMI